MVRLVVIPTVRGMHRITPESAPVLIFDSVFHVVSPRASKPARLHFLSVHLILSPTYWRFYHAAIRDLPVARTSKYVHPVKPKFRVEFTSVPPIIAENSTNETSVSNNKIIIIQFTTIKLYVKLE